MNNEIRQKALVATARAYMAKEGAIRYDQYSMDRLVRVTPRRMKTLPPEAASSVFPVYLDCSSFVWACYYQTFGYELENDLCSSMADGVRPCVFSYTFSHRETRDEREEFFRKVLDCLEAGDLILYLKKDNGHVMLYEGNSRFIHCSSFGNTGSYDYRNCHDRATGETGSVLEEPLTSLTDPQSKRYLFREEMQEFRILRPLVRCGDPTPASLARLEDAADLSVSVLPSPGGLRSVAPGMPVTYEVVAENRSDREIFCTLSVDSGEGDRKREFSIGARSCRRERFSVMTGPEETLFAARPSGRLNGLPLYFPPVRKEKRSEPEKKKALAAAFPRKLLSSLFCRVDSSAGDVLYRKPQDPARDWSPYGGFGGIGVLTPEKLTDPLVRISRISGEDLELWDVILVTDSVTFETVSKAVLTEKGLILYDGDEKTVLSAEAEAAFFDRLPGRFCYAVFRPV